MKYLSSHIIIQCKDLFSKAVVKHMVCIIFSAFPANETFKISLKSTFFKDCVFSNS